MVLVTQGIVYALVIFVPSLIFLCPPIIKFIQRKTRLKKVVLGIFATIVMSFALFGTSRHSAALKEENIRINQEKRKEEQERKSSEEQKRTEEQQKNEEEKKAELAAANKKAEHKQKKDKEDKDTKSTDKEKTEQTKDKDTDKSQAQQSQAQKQVQPQQKSKKVVVRASKKSGQYYTPGHPSYNKVAPNNVVVYSSEEAAARAGYKKAA
jgi:hypothetical protein